ncbi:hypothetical protein [Paenibacillus sp. MDMC362]|uniref:hypothetical protein n=1 Tax=Paenibacillus sp. MDMC362 TaxID=2977365 RepID=UPI000DC2D030|nr:hypothetical protein [Paenibacillus sp. MDMC362]RAR43005.1 hypothetical protein DP091_15050 [Paenibacillus sp. MDMC362]
MPNKIGGLKLLFICAGLGLILLCAGCTLKTEEDAKPEVVNVPAEEMIAIPWNKGWSPAISVTRGIPLELNGSDEIVYDISGDTGYLCVEIEGRLESMSKTGTSRKAEEQFYWNPFCGDLPADLAEIGTSWITLVRKQDGYPTGMVLIRISPEQDNGNRGSTFKADIIASLAFPQQDGAYQDIFDEDLKELEAAYKN